MMDSSSRPARKVAVADHIWDAFEEMASQMGSDRDALINQAMFMFARLNGFIESSGAPRPNGANGRPAAPSPAPARAPAAPPQVAPAAGGRPAPAARPPPESPSKLDDDPVRREVAERVLETAAELERLIKGKNQGGGGGGNFDSASGEEPPADVDVGNVDVDEGAGPALYLMAEGGELDKIAKDRFVIGRGKHCDFVINSGKVSREHAVVVREGGDFFVEDLGSSNGTWFNKQRIKRRKIEDGDEYFICSEKVKFVFR